MASIEKIDTSNIETKCVNTIRALAMDAVKKASSGHSGTPMALAPLAHVLYTRVLKHDPSNPQWLNRDRLVLSAGHASMLLYSSLYLSGYDLSLEDLKEFRQYESKTPGHPEARHTAGVEVTTGPLGQGFANAVGMAIAEEYLRETLGSQYIDHNIFVICGDGDLMEGISYEAASLAGHNKLSKLVAIYDDNKITIDGSTDLSFSEDVAARFRSQGWNVIQAGEISEDLDALEKALTTAKSHDEGPTLIIVRSHIGYPSSKFIDTSAAHGAITDQEEIDKTKAAMGLEETKFHIDPEVINFYKERADRFKSQSKSDRKALEELSQGSDSKSILAQDLINLKPSYFDISCKKNLDVYFDNEAPSTGDKIATRVSCSKILSTISKHAPGLIGGSADLTGNTGTKIADSEIFNAAQRQGRQIYFGIREHAMGAMATSICLSYNLSSFVGTFFVFSDYMKPSIRLASLTKTPALFVFSHDSVGVGEDGPTHQPIEHLAALRAVPGLNVVRPADAYETAAAIEQHFKNYNSPTALILTRQSVPVNQHTADLAREGIEKGAYILSDSTNPKVVLVGTGSEVHLCVEAAQALRKDETDVRVVSMPNMGKFLKLSNSEKRKILGNDIPVISIEAGSTYGWNSVADQTIGIDRFGVSAPGDEVMDKLGININALVDAANTVIKKGK